MYQDCRHWSLLWDKCSKGIRYCQGCYHNTFRDPEAFSSCDTTEKEDYPYPPKHTTRQEYEDAQAKWIKKHNLKYLSKVKIIRVFEERNRFGYPNHHFHGLDSIVNRTTKIMLIEKNYISVEAKDIHPIGAAVPYFILQAL